MIFIRHSEIATVNLKVNNHFILGDVYEYKNFTC